MELGIVRLYDDAWLPMPATDNSACLDVSADFWQDKVTVYSKDNEKFVLNVTSKGEDDEKVLTIRPGDRVLVPTGISLLIPHGCYVLVYPRSGLSVKQGLNLVNNVGVIDSDYSGELLVPLVNTSNVPVEIYDGSRIAQIVLVVSPAWSIKVRTYDELMTHVSTSNRKVDVHGGFGSTGML